MTLQTRFEGRPIGIFMALTGVLILTPDTLFMRLAEMPGYQMVAWRGLLSGTIYLGIWLAFQPEKQQARLPALGMLLSVSGVTLVVAQFFNSLLFVTGIALSPVSVVLFGVATVPVFATILSRIIAKEKTPASLWLAAPLVLLGIGVAMFGGGGGIALNLNVLLGGLAGLGVAFFMALSFVLIRRHPDLPFLPAIAIGALLSGTFGVIMAGGDITSHGNLFPIIVTGLFILPVPFFLLSLASRYTLPANVSIILLLETTLGPLWVWLGYDEAPTRAMIIGGALVVITLAFYIHTSMKNETNLIAK